MDETTARVYEKLAELEAKYEELQDRCNDLQEQIAGQDGRINDLGLRLKQLERPRMTNDEALRLFDQLKNLDPSINLPSFAARYGLSADALRQARSRRRKKT